MRGWEKQWSTQSWGFPGPNCFSTNSSGWKRIPYGCMDAAAEDSRVNQFAQHRFEPTEPKLPAGDRAAHGTQQWTKNRVQLAAGYRRLGRLAGSPLPSSDARAQHWSCGHAVDASGRQADSRQSRRSIRQTGDRRCRRQNGTVRKSSWPGFVPTPRPACLVRNGCTVMCGSRSAWSVSCGRPARCSIFPSLQEDAVKDDRVFTGTANCP